MAYWARRKDNHQVRIWTNDGKNLPRKTYRHLDSQPDFNIRQWIDNYERQYEGKTWTPDRLPDGTLKTLLGQYLTYLETVKKRDRGTIHQHDWALREYAFPFFLGQEPPMQNPNDWVYVSGRLCEFFLNKGVSGSIINRTQTALRGFWRWGRAYQHITTVVPLETIPAVVASQPTPLKDMPTPEEILAVVINMPKDIQLITMLGYFFSLRPYEILAVKYEDFRAGSGVAGLEAAKAMRVLGLYDKLAINVRRQRDKYGTVKTLKTAESRGWVCCFNRQAAALTVTLLNDLAAADGTLLPYSYDQYDNKWKAAGLKTLGLKDLRRASLYWIGHNTPISGWQLMKHARHTRIATLLKYLRRAEEHIDVVDVLLDLDS